MSDENSIYPNDYSVAHKSFKARDIDENRFVKFEDREPRSVLTLDMIKVLCHGKYQTNWNGVQMLKSPLDLVTIQDFLGREKPATVIELGTYSGGCTLWFADVLKSFGLKSHVYSVDCSFDFLHERAKKNEKSITLILGDIRKEVEKAFPEEMLKKLPHPWFISEDCHVPLEKTLGYFDRFMEPGDYILVEDTHPSFPAFVGQGLNAPGFTEFGLVKHNELAQFVKARPGKYLVDTHYTDFFGYNGSSSMNSYLKRI